MRERKRKQGRPQKLRRRERCFVYVLGCFSGPRHLTYVGWTNDLHARLAKHNAGKGARSTRGRVWILLHSERFFSRRKAMSREWHLKRDRKFRRALVIGHLSTRGATAPI